ncbi:MAG: TusE/DsrC/DsvC family sulfur relay protein, partial [Pseudomonadota bacterium]
MPRIKVENNDVEVNEQGFLVNIEDWSEAYAEATAHLDNIKLFNDHWELIYYFREYFQQNEHAPSMHQMIMGMMPKTEKFLDKKKYEKHIYSLFPSDPIRNICKLS